MLRRLSLIATALAVLLTVGSASTRSADAGPRAATSGPLTDSTRAAESTRAAMTVETYSGGSTVLEAPIYSPILDLHTSYRVFLPPGYDGSWRYYPVLYMLHGVAGDSTEWQSIGLLEAADRLIQRGEIEPMIVVLPNGGANYWLNQAGGARWMDYVAQDVVREVDREYRTIGLASSRAIGGLSMGGEGALRIAMTSPSVFGTAAAHSPSLRTGYDQFAPEVAALYGDEDQWRAATPLWLVVDTDTAYRLNIALDIGEDDPWRPNVELLHERMVARGIKHQFDILPGEHAAEYWIENVDRYLAFYSRALTGSAAASMP